MANFGNNAIVPGFDDAIQNLKVSAERRASASLIFPLAFSCPRCSSKLKTAKPGKFICSTCKTRLVVDERGGLRIWSDDDVLGGSRQPG